MEDIDAFFDDLLNDLDADRKQTVGNSSGQQNDKEDFTLSFTLDDLEKRNSNSSNPPPKPARNVDSKPVMTYDDESSEYDDEEDHQHAAGFEELHSRQPNTYNKGGMDDDYVADMLNTINTPTEKLQIEQPAMPAMPVLSEDRKQAPAPLSYGKPKPRVQKSEQDDGARQSVLDMIDNLVIDDNGNKTQASDGGVRDSVFYMIDSLVSDEAPNQTNAEDALNDEIIQAQKLEAHRAKQEELANILGDVENEKERIAETKKVQHVKDQERLKSERLAQESIDSALNAHRDHVLQIQIQPYEDSVTAAANALAAIIRNTKQTTAPYLDLAKIAAQGLAKVIQLVKAEKEIFVHVEELAESINLITQVVKRLVVSSKTLVNHESEQNKKNLQKDCFDGIVMLKDLRTTIEETIIQHYNKNAKM